MMVSLTLSPGFQLPLGSSLGCVSGLWLPSKDTVWLRAGFGHTGKLLVFLLPWHNLINGLCDLKR